MLLKRDFNTGAFLRILRNLLKHLCYRIPPMAASIERNNEIQQIKYDDTLFIIASLKHLDCTYVVKCCISIKAKRLQKLI